jgi:hypothetical protein
LTAPRTDSQRASSSVRPGMRSAAKVAVQPPVSRPPQPREERGHLGGGLGTEANSLCGWVKLVGVG